MKMMTISLVFLTALLGSRASYGQISAGNYFDQFIFQGTCPKPAETAKYDTLSSKIRPALAVTNTGEALVPALELQLFADGTYYAVYEEWFQNFGASSASSVSRDGKSHGIFKTVSGKWINSGTRISVDGLGLGYPAFDSQNNPAIYIEFNLDIGTKGLAGKYMQLSKVQSGRSPRDACN